MAKVFIYGQMGPFTMVIGKIMRDVVMVFMSGLMEVNTLAFGKMMFGLEKAFIKIDMD